jgi:hypothetical protein
MNGAEPLSRRELLRHGGTLAVAAGIGAVVPLPLLANRKLAPGSFALGPMQKCISFGGPGSLREDRHPDDYRFWGNREFVKQSRTSWIKLWVSWADLQREAPRTREQSWEQLDDAPGGESWLRRLDGQVKAANDDGVRVIVTLFHAFPAWSSGATGPDPVSPRKPAEQKLPTALDPDSPWGWFVSHLCARYRESRPRNPDGASIDALEICNEPNLLYWPQEDVVRAVAQMIRSAERISASLGGPAILAPATSDYPDQDQESDVGVLAQGWPGFTERLLTELGDLRPEVPLLWTQHNFNDVQRPEERTRAKRVLELLASKGWPTQVQPLWLTEGGYNLHPNEDESRAQLRQAHLIEANFQHMRNDRRVYLWTQHTITDKPGNDFKSGLRGDFIPGQGVGAPRPAWRTWRELP